MTSSHLKLDKRTAQQNQQHFFLFHVICYHPLFFRQFDLSRPLVDVQQAMLSV